MNLKRFDYRQSDRKDAESAQAYGSNNRNSGQTRLIKSLNV